MRLVVHVAAVRIRGAIAPSLLAVALVAVAVAFSAAAVAGARRNDAALPAFLEASRPPAGDGAAFMQLDESIPFEDDDQTAARELLLEHPDVVTAVRGTGFVIGLWRARGGWQPTLAYGSLDHDGVEDLFGRPLLLEGAWPPTEEATSIVVDEEFAERYRVEVGDGVPLGVYTLDQLEEAGGGTPVDPRGDVFEATVSAVVRYPDDLLPPVLDQENLYVNGADIVLTPGFWDRFGPDVARWGIGTVFGLEPGSDRSAMEADISEAAGGRAYFEPTGLLASDEPLEGIQRAISLQSRATLVVGASVGAAALILMVMVAFRQARVEHREMVVWRSLGWTERDEVVVGAVRYAVIGTVGAVLGAAVAVLASPLFPMGVARRAVIDVPIRLDLAVITSATIAVLLAAVTIGATARFLALRRGPLHRRVARPAWSARLGAVAGAGPTTLAGWLFAFGRPGEGRGSPNRAAAGGLVLGGAVVVAAALLVVNFDVLAGQPERHGIPWDATVGNYASADAADDADRLIDQVDGISSVPVGILTIAIDGTPLDAAVDFDPGGPDPFLVVEGRSPEASDEIALGPLTMDRLGISVDDVVPVRATDALHDMRVVAAVVQWNPGAPGTISLGKGALVTSDAVPVLDPLGAPEAISPQFHALFFDGDVDHAAKLDELRRDFPSSTVTPVLPADLANLERIRSSPLLIGGVVAALAALSSVVALLGTMRRRRHDIAVLRALGFVRGQARAVALWQAAALALVGVALALPFGLVAGRALWTLLMEQLGLEVALETPAWIFAATATGTVGVLLAASMVPATVAGRVQAARALRTE